MMSAAMITIIMLMTLSIWVLAIMVVFIHRMLHIPMQIQRKLKSQGIDGPRFNFIRGNTQELLKMRQQIRTSGPMSSNLSHAVDARIQPHIVSWMKTYGKTFVFWVGPRAHLVVAELDLVKKLLHNKDRAYPKLETSFYIKKLMGDGLAFSSGDKWLHMRKLAHNAFHGESLRKMIPAMVWSAEKMVEKWKSYIGKEIEVDAEFKLLTSEVISRTAFGTNYPQGRLFSQMLAELAKFIKEDHQFNFFRPGLFSKMYRSRDEIEAQRLERGIKDLIIRMVQEREDAAANGNCGYGSDFLGLLVKSYHDESKEVSINNVVDECKTFYVAGQHPTNFLLSWAVYLLSVHTNWQEEARNEVVSQFGWDGVPDADGISKLKVLSMIINETLRLYPSSIELTRKVERGAQLGHLSLPGNLNLVVPVLAIHHDAEIWGKDVHQFKPERFREGISEATNNNPVAFIPFGLGPRSCVGSNFVTLEAKVVLSMILQRFSFTLSPAYTHSIYPAITIRPMHGVQVILQAA
ncbi:Cytochrome P450 CYP749A22 [Linum perenne]